MHTQGLFITLEGGDGAGKTTLMKHLGNYFAEEGHEVLMTREPGGSRLGETIRSLLLGQNPEIQVSAKAELLLFLAARAQHLEEKIIPALKRRVVVLCDRFNDSTIAYQAAARGLGIDRVRDLCRFVCDEYQPVLTFFLDIDPVEGLRRAFLRSSNKTHPDRMEAEGIEFHHRVRTAFMRLVHDEPQRIKRLDASRTELEVYQEAIQYIKGLNVCQ